jgi:hypothetical protein
MLKAIHASEDVVAAREKAIRVIEKLHALRLIRAAELVEAAAISRTWRRRLVTGAYYTEPRLLNSIMFYASAAILFFDAFIMRYRLELVHAFPLVALVMSDFSLAFKPQSVVQVPVKLYREPTLVTAVVACAAIMTALLFIEIALYLCNRQINSTSTTVESSLSRYL